MPTRQLTLIVFASIIAVSVLVRGAFSQAAPQAASICAIDMGSNTFRRIVGSFQNGKYVQRPIEKKTVGVGDDVAHDGRISEAKLAEIGTVLSGSRAPASSRSLISIARCHGSWPRSSSPARLVTRASS